MKKIMLFFFSVLICLFSFSQNQDISGIWKIVNYEVHVKTNYPLLTKQLQEIFAKNLDYDNDNSSLILFAEDGNAYQNGKYTTAYTINKDSLSFADISGKFIIKNNILTITSDITELMVIDYKNIRPRELQELKICHIDSILIDKVILEYQLHKIESITPSNFLATIFIPEGEEFDNFENIESDKDTVVSLIKSKDTESEYIAIKIAEISEHVTRPNAIDSEEKPFVLVEQMPSFKGGEKAMEKFIDDNLQYPEIALKQGIEGRVIIEFVVNKDGKLSNILIIKSADNTIDKEALRIIRLMPDWIPGKQNGIAVPVYYTLSILFKPPLEKIDKK